MKTVSRVAIGAISILCLAAQTPPPAKPAQPDEPKQEKPQSLPPGPLGLQPMLDNSGKADSSGKTDAKPAGDAADPNKMATPAESDAPGARIPGTSPVDSKAYIIGAEDVLSVLVWGQPALSGSFVVRPDGRFSLPLVGDVQAAGESPEQLSKEIEQKLKDSKILLDPNVTVGLTAIHSKKYFIEGEVNHPGSFDLTVPTTIMQGLVNAGGFRDFAKKSDIIILRDGGRKVLHFNYNQVIKGKHLEENVLLEPGDHIVIK